VTAPVASGARMAGRVAIVTGSTSGIGQRIAERYAEEGAAVVVTGRRVRLGETVAQGIRDAGGVAEFIAADLTDVDQAAHLVETTAERFGRLDTLVNNAGDPGSVRSTDGPLHTTTPEVWDSTYRSSVRTALAVTRAALPHLQRSEGGGRIVSISSVFAVRGAGYDTYSWTKAALVGLTRSLAVSYAADRICANCLTVGYVVVDRSAEMWTSPALRDHWRQVALTRPGVPDDVAAPCLWLGSDEAGYVTGAVIAVDGGMEVKGDPSFLPGWDPDEG